MPPAIVDRLADEITKMLKDPGVRTRLGNAGVMTQDGEVKQTFGDRIQRDVNLWKPMIEQAGIKPS
jgi:tripartite-type tricarboxylate transporter receptor subunit TctC